MSDTPKSETVKAEPPKAWSGAAKEYPKTLRLAGAGRQVEVRTREDEERAIREGYSAVPAIEEYPKVLYHRTAAAKTVGSLKEEKAELKKGWSTKPLPENPPAGNYTPEGVRI